MAAVAGRLAAVVAELVAADIALVAEALADAGAVHTGQRECAERALVDIADQK